MMILILMLRLRLQEERFPAFHASLQPFGTWQTHIGMSAGEHHGRASRGIEFIEANNAGKWNDFGNGLRDFRPHILSTIG